MLTVAPSAVPLTATLHQRAMRVSLPLPSEPDSPTLTVDFRPSSEEPYFSLQVDHEGLSDDLRTRLESAASAAVQDVDAVATIHRLLSGL